MSLELFFYLLIAAIFLLSVVHYLIRTFRKWTTEKDISISSEVSNPTELKKAEQSLNEEGAGEWVTVASTSTHKGFREADLQGAVAFLGSKDIPATYRTSASAEGIQDFSLQVPVEHVEQAKELLVEFFKK